MKLSPLTSEELEIISKNLKQKISPGTLVRFKTELYYFSKKDNGLCWDHSNHNKVALSLDFVSIDKLDKNYFAYRRSQKKEIGIHTGELFLSCLVEEKIRYAVGYRELIKLKRDGSGPEREIVYPWDIDMGWLTFLV